MIEIKLKLIFEWFAKYIEHYLDRIKVKNDLWVIGQIYWTISWSNKSEKWPLSEPYPKDQIMRWLRLSNGPSSGYYKVCIYSTIQVIISNHANRTNKVKRPCVFNFDRFNQLSTRILFEISISLNLDWSTFDESFYSGSQLRKPVLLFKT